MTENKLRAELSDRPLARVAFNPLFVSYSIHVKQGALKMAPDLRKSVIEATVETSVPIAHGSASAVPAQFFSDLCFPPSQFAIERTSVNLASPQAEWSGTIEFAATGERVRALLKLADKDWHFRLTAANFFTAVYSNANDDLLHCSLPFGAGVFPDRAPATEDFDVATGIFPGQPIQLAEVRLAPGALVEAQLRAVRTSMFWKVVAYERSQ